MFGRLIIVLLLLFLGTYLYEGSIQDAWEVFGEPWYLFWPLVFLGVYLWGKMFPETTYMGRQVEILKEAEQKVQEENHNEKG